MQTVHPHPEHATALPKADVARWRSAISAGNRAFQEEAYLPALEHYTTALVWAMAMFGRIEDAHVGTATLVIAHHNLADTYAELGRVAEQCHHLCAAHERLQAVRDDPAAAPAWREAALSHSRRTHLELTRFLASHPGHPQALATRAREPGPGPSGRAH